MSSAFLLWLIAVALAALPAAWRPLAAPVPVYAVAREQLPPFWCGATHFLVWPGRVEPVLIVLRLDAGCPDPLAVLLHEYRHVLCALLYADTSEACQERLEGEQ